MSISHDTIDTIDVATYLGCSLLHLSIHFCWLCQMQGSWGNLSSLIARSFHDSKSYLIMTTCQKISIHHAHLIPSVIYHSGRQVIHA